MCPIVRTMNRAFSLVEMLVVILVIGVLAAMLFPLLARSKEQAHTVDNISKLRQLGQASSLYEQANGEFPGRAPMLVEVGLITAELCGSKRDNRPMGIANELVTAMSKKRYETMGVPTPSVVPFQNTFVGPEDYGFPSKGFYKQVSANEGGGWLLDFTEATRNELPYPLWWEGSYRRLLLDGSVVHRRLKNSEGCSEGGSCRRGLSIFVDEVAEKP